MELDRVIRAVRILREKPATLVPIALDEAGFGSAKVGRAAIKRVAGMPAREVRSLIGWYWIVQRWVELYWPFSEKGRAAAPTG
ncbi:MAG: hypothetical protein ACREKI_00130 [Gemmatimonadota bacterium]